MFYMIWLIALSVLFLVGILTYVFTKPDSSPRESNGLGALAALTFQDEKNLVSRYKVMNTIGNIFLFIPGLLAFIMGYYVEGSLMIIAAIISTIYHIIETPAWRAADSLSGKIYSAISFIFLIQLARVQWGNPVIILSALLAIGGLLIFAIYAPGAKKEKSGTDLVYIENRLIHSLWHIIGVMSILLILTQMLSVPSQIPNKGLREYVIRKQLNYKTTLPVKIGPSVTIDMFKQV